MEPDPQLVYEAQWTVNAANTDIIQQSLKWYEHWCHVGNGAAAEVAANTLRAEIAKARESLRKSVPVKAQEDKDIR